MKAFLFYHFKLKVTLAEVLAKTEQEAWKLLVSQHEWANANNTNCDIKRVVSIEEPIGFDALLPSY